MKKKCIPLSRGKALYHLPQSTSGKLIMQSCLLIGRCICDPFPSPLCLLRILCVRSIYGFAYSAKIRKTVLISNFHRLYDICSHAKAYHIIDIRSLLSGWTLFEIASVSVSPIVHNSTQDLATRKLVLNNLRKNGFNGSKFHTEIEKSFLKEKILARYGSIQRFDENVFAIVDKFLNVSYLTKNQNCIESPPASVYGVFIWNIY